MSKVDQLRALREARFQSQAKATKGKAGTAGVTGAVRRSTAGTGLRVGEAVAVQPATSEITDVTSRERPATNSKRGRPLKGEQRDKPWLKTNPPLSKSAYYRRKAAGTLP